MKMNEMELSKHSVFHQAKSSKNVGYGSASTQSWGVFKVTGDETSFLDC